MVARSLLGESVTAARAPCALSRVLDNAGWSCLACLFLQGFLHPVRRQRAQI